MCTLSDAYHEADRLKLHKHKAAENTTILCSLLATCKAKVTQGNG